MEEDGDGGVLRGVWAERGIGGGPNILGQELQLPIRHPSICPLGCLKCFPST